MLNIIWIHSITEIDEAISYRRQLEKHLGNAWAAHWIGSQEVRNKDNTSTCSTKVIVQMLNTLSVKSFYNLNLLNFHCFLG